MCPCLYKTASSVSEADSLRSMCLLVGSCSFHLTVVVFDWENEHGILRNDTVFTLIYISKARMMHQQSDEMETLTATETDSLL